MPTTAQAVDEPPREGIRDTIESIIVALILAFVFRSFIVEAFVIPTGSMAPTLYGAHATIICEDCGSEFAYGLLDLSDQRKSVAVRATSKAYCPNCGHPNTDLHINDIRRNPESGDRILVLKWPFDLPDRLLGPARWDVVVFKDPSDGVTNFIKRLVGLPDEVLMILDGDLYTVSTDELSTDALAELDQRRREKYEFRTGSKRGRLGSVSRVTVAELDSKMRIAEKTAVAQSALWFPVYSHDHPPRASTKAGPYWQPKHAERSGWDASSRRVRFEDRGLADDYIELAGPAVLATCSYNITHASRTGQYNPHNPPPPVADQRVRFVLTPTGGAGRVAVRLTKLGRAFRVTVGVDGLVQIEEIGRATGRESAVMRSTRVSPIAPGRSIEIGIENVDYRIAVRVGGKEVLATSKDPNAEGYYGPDLSALRRLRRQRPACRPRIHAEGGSFELTHLIVDRDVYYFHSPGSRPVVPWLDPGETWASPENPMLLRGHEFFMLGDNPAASKDSRLWDSLGPHLAARGEQCQLGAVPRDQLIGKAFFVYWPSMQRIEWLEWVPLLGRWGIVPDVGRMRWIR